MEDRGGIVVFEEETILSPEKVYDRVVPIGEARFQDLVLKVNDLSCEAVLEQDLEIPDPAEAALKPEEIDTCEQLYLTGLHLEPPCDLVCSGLLRGGSSPGSFRCEE